MAHPSSDELLIARLFDLPAAARPAFWQRACADDPALPARHPEFARLFSTASPAPVDGLAAAAMAGVLASALGRTGHDAPGMRIGPMAGVLESALSGAEHEAPGVRIGHYKLLQKIGEGGFGAVWMAEQLEPIRRRVAMKIVKVGMDTEEVIARFEVERQALALMDHPNIARVFDAGATASGRPYFVMELVRGVAITRYCDDNRLPAEARLRLFVSICQAVQHAHQKGVIHRDLKPSNILVTVHDGTPVPKVIDFGIAKATDKQLTEKTLVTQFHAFVGTPAYTSPEQMEMSGLDVDTRSDIYSLGVLLYELLAGRPPFDPDALIKSGLEAMRRTIREIDPPRPSHRLGTLNEVERTSVAHARSTDAAKLSVLLRGDVDWIVMHCLEKDRTRRYETANALARDVQRHLAHEPVSARPPSSLYRLQKLYRRHKLGVTAAAAIAVSVIAGLIVSSTLFVRERAARTRAVAAEKSEEKLRLQAEAARTAEALRASRTSLAFAEQLFSAEGRAREGLAHLVRAARSDPDNHEIGERLVSTLAFRSFAEPIGEPLSHPAPLRKGFYSHDGRHCLTSAEDGGLRYWDLSSGRMLHSIDVGGSIAAELSPDTKRIAVVGLDGTVNIWQVETGQKVAGPFRHESQIWVVRFSPDGRLLCTGSDDLTARIWDSQTGKLHRELRHEHRVLYVDFSPDGTRLLTTTRQGPARIWRVADGKPLTPNLADKSWAVTGAYSPDGQVIALGFNTGGVQIIDATTGRTMGARMPHNGPCDHLTFTRDGKRLVTGSTDATARVWDVPTGRPALDPLQHGGAVSRLFVTPDNRHLLTGSGDNIVRVWDLANGRLALEPIHVGELRHAALAPDGSEFLTEGRDGNVRRWRVAPGAAVSLRLNQDPKIIGARVEPHDATVLLAVERDRIRNINLLNGRTVGPPRLFPTSIDRVRFAPNGERLAVITNGMLEIWDLRNAEIGRQRMSEFKAPNFTPDTYRFSADSTLLAYVDETGSLRIWSSDTGALVAGPLRSAERFAISAGSRLLAFKAGVTARIWDFATQRFKGEPLRHRETIYGLAFSPDGRLLATASGEGVRLWDTETTQPIGQPLPHRTYARGVAFSRDGRRLVSWTPTASRVWDVATHAPLTEPMIGGVDIDSAVANRDGTRIVTMSRADLKARLWSGESGQLLADPLKSGGRAIPAFLTDTKLVVPFTDMWALPPQSGGNPVPAWLLRLATAFAGGEIDAHAVFREQAFEAKAFDAIRRELHALPDTAPYVEWGRWILADRATRPIAPGFKITAPDAARFGVAPSSSVPATVEP